MNHEVIASITPMLVAHRFIDCSGVGERVDGGHVPLGRQRHQEQRGLLKQRSSEKGLQETNLADIYTSNTLKVSDKSRQLSFLRLAHTYISLEENICNWT